MKAKLVCYTLGKKSHRERSKLKRELFGYMDKSNNGEYKYERKGLLDKIPNIRPIRSVIITKKEYVPKLKRLLIKYGAKIHTFDVLLKKSI